MSLVDTTTILIETLRSRLPNPGVAEWIYSDYPRMDATFPRISLHQSSGSVTEPGIGRKGASVGENRYSLTYDIDVWVKPSNRAVINNDVFVGTKLRDKYADLIISALDASLPSLWQQHGIEDIEVINIMSHPYDTEYNLHRKTITVVVTRCV